MKDNIFVMDQMHDLWVLVSKLGELKVQIPESVLVEAIIAKHLLSWNHYCKKLLKMTQKLTLEKIWKHIRIEEENKNRDGVFPSSNVNNVISKTKRKNSQNQNFKPNKKSKHENKSNLKDKMNRTCFNYGKIRC